MSLARLIAAALAPALLPSALHSHEGWITVDGVGCPVCQAELELLRAARAFQTRHRETTTTEAT